VRTRPCRACGGVHCHHGYEGRDDKCAWCGGVLGEPPPAAAEREPLMPLLDAWAERDRRYSRRREPPTPAEVSAARVYRAREVEALAPADRPLARAALSRLSFGFADQRW